MARAARTICSHEGQKRRADDQNRTNRARAPRLAHKATDPQGYICRHQAEPVFLVVGSKRNQQVINRLVRMKYCRQNPQPVPVFPLDRVVERARAPGQAFDQHLPTIAQTFGKNMTPDRFFRQFLLRFQNRHRRGAETIAVAIDQDTPGHDAIRIVSV